MRTAPAAAVLLLAGSLPAAAQDGAPLVRPEAPTHRSEVEETRELVVPAAAAMRLRVDNPLGHVWVRGREGMGELHIKVTKHAPTPQILARLRVRYTAWESGEVQVDTRVDLGGREQSLPLAASRIDMVIEAPARLRVEARTFGGDLVMSGLRAGARLETTGGRIDVSDVRGGVITRQLRGGQSVMASEGEVDLDGIESDLLLRGVAGPRLDARTVEGTIRAEGIRSGWVRLTSTMGDVVYIGLVRPTARYEMRSYAGEVRFTPGAGAAPFELRSRSGRPLESALAMAPLAADGAWVRASWAPPRAPWGERAVVELSSVLGRVVIQPVSTRSQD